MTASTTNTQSHECMILQKLPRLIQLSNSQFLYPYLTRKSTSASSVFHKELHFSSSVFFLSCWDHVWGRDHAPPPPSPLSPQRTALFGAACQSGKSAPCSVCSAHIITQRYPFFPDLMLPKWVSNSDYWCASSS